MLLRIPAGSGGAYFFLHPVIQLWFSVGLVIALLYHLSLIFIDREFRNRETLFLDVFISALRFLLYMFAWPGVLYFDRGALPRIKLFLKWLWAKPDKEDPEVVEATAETSLVEWTEKHQAAEQGRLAELGQLPLERERRAVALHESHPRLDGFWLLAAVGRDNAGASQLVWLYGQDLTFDEITERARTEVGLRHEAVCPRCDERLAPARVSIPPLQFLRVLGYDDQPIVEGWALEGKYAIEWMPCDDCAGAIEPSEEAVTRFGRARDIIRALRSGLVFHQDTGSGPDEPAKAARSIPDE